MSDNEYGSDIIYNTCMSIIEDFVKDIEQLLIDYKGDSNA